MVNFLKNLSGSNNPAKVTMPTTASETYTYGEALVLSSGKLTKCTGTTPPSYVSLANYVAPATGMLPLAVANILESDVYVIDKASGSFAAIVPGDKLVLGTDGLTVTPATTAGVFTVDEVLATQVRGRFLFTRYDDYTSSALDSFTAVTLTQTGGAGAGTTQYQTAAAVIAVLPTSIIVTLENAETANIPITWADTDSYAPDTAATYTFTATWGTMPTGANNDNSLAVPTVELIVAA